MKTLSLVAILGSVLGLYGQAQAQWYPATLNTECGDKTDEIRLMNGTQRTIQGAVQKTEMTHNDGYYNISPNEIRCWPRSSTGPIQYWFKDGSNVTTNRVKPYETLTYIGVNNVGRGQHEWLPGPDTCPPKVGSKISLKSDTGLYFSRCRDCQTGIQDSVTIHAKEPKGAAVFTVVDAGGNKLALLADTGKYLARCQGCIKEAPTDMLTIRSTTPVGMAFEYMASGKCSIKADNGKYLGRCRSCSKTTSIPDTVAVIATNPNLPENQVQVVKGQ